MKYQAWGILSTWFMIWFLVRLLGWSLGWFENDWIWTTVYLFATVFCVTRYSMVKEAKTKAEEAAPNPNWAHPTNAILTTPLRKK